MKGKDGLLAELAGVVILSLGPARCRLPM